ncbi:MAG: trypsin-like peptidase domain-containing protein [Prevotellaceae bacterium]|jgi:S1-C subfamily serine protease|nr:trypsin-like peptidase domain-containing protein [Prevotellaceae bacterium]
MKNSNILRTIVLLVFASLVGGLVSAVIIGKTQKQQPAINLVAPREMPVSAVAFSPGGEPVNFSDAAEHAVPAVVHVQVAGETQRRYYGRSNDLFDYFFGNPGEQRYQEYTPRGSGSGVIISDNGYIVTNNHVVEKASEITVIFNDKTSFVATVVGKDPTTDIALLKVETDIKLPALGFADSDNLRLGEWVLAIGNPFNLTSTVTAGIVSAKARKLSGPNPNDFGIESFIQTDAVINPGNSGGALINLKGELVGINTAIASHTGLYEGYSFAIPSNVAKKVVQDLIEFGVVQRALLGIHYVDLSAFESEELLDKFVKSLKEEDNIDVDAAKLKALRKKEYNGTCICVIEVLDNSAAKDAGIEKYDIITKIKNKDVTSKNVVVDEVNKLRPGDNIEISLIRDGKMKQITAVLRNKAGNTGIVSDDKIEILGARFENVDQELAAKLKIKGGVQVVELNDEGKLINRVRKGFIITRVNQKPVTSVEELTSLINSLKRGEGVFIEGVYPNGRRDYIAFEL